MIVQVLSWSVVQSRPALLFSHTPTPLVLRASGSE
uniref:Uncharacterized protein n=1 Tax=Arundo donax TaxID=35708 RepID=A0A0A9BWC8_ARUDO